MDDERNMDMLLRMRLNDAPPVAVMVDPEGEEGRGERRRCLRCNVSERRSLTSTRSIRGIRLAAAVPYGQGRLHVHVAALGLVQAR